MTKVNWSVVLSLISIFIAIPSLWLSWNAYDIANTKLTDVENQLNRLDKNSLFLKTESCERAWFENSPEIKIVSCYNGTWWDDCIYNDTNFQAYGCENTDWYQEIIETYSWKNTEGTW